MFALFEGDVDVLRVDVDVPRDDFKQVRLQRFNELRREREMIGKQNEPQPLLGLHTGWLAPKQTRQKFEH